MSNLMAASNGLIALIMCVPVATGLLGFAGPPSWRPLSTTAHSRAQDLGARQIRLRINVGDDMIHTDIKFAVDGVPLGQGEVAARTTRLDPGTTQLFCTLTVPDAWAAVSILSSSTGEVAYNVTRDQFDAWYRESAVAIVDLRGTLRVQHVIVTDQLGAPVTSGYVLLYPNDPHVLGGTVRIRSGDPYFVAKSERMKRIEIAAPGFMREVREDAQELGHVRLSSVDPISLRLVGELDGLRTPPCDGLVLAAYLRPVEVSDWKPSHASRDTIGRFRTSNASPALACVPGDYEVILAYRREDHDFVGLLALPSGSGMILHVSADNAKEVRDIPVSREQAAELITKCVEYAAANQK